MQGAITLQRRTQPCYSQTPGRSCMQHRRTVQKAFRIDDSNNPTLTFSADRSVAGSKQPDTATQPHTRTPSSQPVSNKPGSRSNPFPMASDQPLWKNPSFPFVAAIAVATLPFDLAVGRHRMAYNTSSQPATHKAPAVSRSSATSSSSVSSIDISSLNRHDTPAVQHSHTPVPDVSVDDIVHEAAVAAGLRKPPTQTDQSTHNKAADPKVPGSNPARLTPGKLSAQVQQAAKQAERAAAAAQSAAAKSSRASQTAADKQNAAGFGSSAAAGSGLSEAAAASGIGVPSGPVDSWDSSEQAGLGSDEEAEQAAKAMVIELLTHPKDTEAALLRAAASQDGGGSAGGRGLSVSPDYIDALVRAAREPSVGMLHQKSSPAAQDNTTTSGNSSMTTPVSVPGATRDMPPKGWGAPSPPSVTQTPPATDPEAAQPPPSTAAAAGTKRHTQGSSRQVPTKSSSPSLWSWFEASPHSSQEEF